MPIKVEKMTREFVFGGMKLPDPNPAFSVEQVREVYIPAYPDLATAAIEGPAALGGVMRYTFKRAVGAKG